MPFLPKYFTQNASSDSIEPIGKGEGQRTFDFRVKCRNYNTLVCQTDREYREANSLVILKYELRPEEREIKNRATPILTDAVSRLNNLSMLNELINANLENVPDGPSEKLRIVDMRPEFNKTWEEYNKHIEQYKDERYSEVEILDSKLE